MIVRFLILLIMTAVIKSQSVTNFNSQNDPLAESVNHRTAFIENKGQWPDEVLFLVRTGGMNAWITNYGVVYDHYEVIRNVEGKREDAIDPFKLERFDEENIRIMGHVVRFTLEGGNRNPHTVAETVLSGYYNYFIGNDPSKWAGYVRLYGEVVIEGIYDGIDVRYYFDGGLIRYDYILAPGSDISGLRFSLEGDYGRRVNEKGELIVETQLGEVHHGKIYAYQLIDGVETEVECRYETGEDGLVGFYAEYNPEKELIIDPLVYSTFLGGSGIDMGYSIAIDNEENAYLTGRTSSPDFPTTPGAYNESFNEVRDVFITKLNAAGSELIYSTFLGGSVIDQVLSIAVDEDGNTYLTGWTSSSDFPTTPGAYNESFNGDFDAFITKLNASGSGLLYSTFLGGSYWNFGHSIAVDGAGYAYVTGRTSSPDFPTTPGAYSESHNGWFDAFVTKMNRSGNGLVYSTFLGGSENSDSGNSITVDGDGYVYLTGYTYSVDYPTTPGAFMENLNGGSDVFITRLNSSGSGLIYSTFLGGSSGDSGASIAIDGDGYAYLTGFTNSPDFPTTPGAYNESLNSVVWGDLFITKFNTAGTDLIYSTYLGGENQDLVNSIAIDEDGNVYLTGYTYSVDYPTTPGAFMENLNEGSDAFITRLNSSGSGLIYSTFLGGSSGGDSGASIAIDGDGYAYLTGRTNSPDFPTTPGAYNESFNGERDAFITKLSLVPVSVKDIPGIPDEYRLSQNFPNPFNPSTTIRYAIPERTVVRLTVYNILGQRVSTIIDGVQGAGYYEVTFDASHLSSGTYIYRLQTWGYVENRKFLYLK